MKIAFVHDYLREAGGAERVLLVLAKMYPEAPIYTAFARRGTALEMLGNEARRVRESKWAGILKIGHMHSYLRFLLPLVWRSLDLREYDLVITSCSGYIARGFGVGEKTRVIAYCHTPPKWLYGYETPTGARVKWWGRAFMFVAGPFMRYFDYKSAERVDTWIANSQEVARRIGKFYRKQATVIYPPVEIKVTVNSKQQLAKRGEYFLLVSRLVGAKGVEEAVAGARLAGVKLKIAGEAIGKQKRIKSNKGELEYLGRVSDEELARLYAGARGFVALANDEDFGMTVVEAMMLGTPVLAVASGGYKETVVEGETGLLLASSKPEVVAEGFNKMKKMRFDRGVIKKWASQYGRVRFEREIRKVVDARVTRG